MRDKQQKILFACVLVAILTAFCLFIFADLSRAQPAPQDTTRNSWPLAGSEWGNRVLDSAVCSLYVDTGTGAYLWDVKWWFQNCYDSIEAKKPSVTITWEPHVAKDLRCLCGWRGINFDLIYEGGPFQVSAERCPDCLMFNHLYDPENGNLYKRYVSIRSWDISPRIYGRRDWHGNLIPRPKPRNSPPDSVLAELRRITGEWE